MNRIGLLSLLAVSASVAAISVMGCSKDPPPAATPTAQPMVNGQYQQYPAGQQPAGYPAQQPAGYPTQQPAGYPTQPAGQPTAAPAGTATGFPGFPTQPAAGGGGGTAQPLDPNLAALATGPLGMYANTEAPGMQKEGNVVAGNFSPGQTLESSFTFTPGKCYTLVAAGAGVTDVGLEMQYTTPIPGLNPSIGTNTTKGSQVSMGGKANCLKPMSPIAASAKFIVKANAGQGVIAAQLYSK